MSRERVELHPKQAHGLTNKHRREYNSWLGARYRCRSKKHPKWDDYGGRGISMCKRWVESFAAFLEDMGPRPEGMELDRIDNDGNYEPSNCRWVSVSENARNQTRAQPKPRICQRKKISRADARRLERIDELDARYQPSIDKLLDKIAVIEAERDQRKLAVIDRIHPQYRPSI